MDLQLDGRVALVVGGAGYIGAAVVDRLRAEGATVVVASRHVAQDDPHAVVLDARDPASIADGVARVVAEHGRLDVLVVTAAPRAQSLDPARASDAAEVLEQIDAKALAFLRVANAVVPTMREAGFGRVVAISGQGGLMTRSIAGGVRNAATVLIAKHLADQLLGTGVLVNSVSPGVVTDDPAPSVPDGQAGETDPAAIADLVAFLASPRSGVSGESIAVGHRVRGVTYL